MPPYESFTLPCDQTFLAGQCKPGVHVQFIVRTADGRSFAQTIGSDGSRGAVLLHGGTMMGPAGAPFGFYRRTPLPGSPMQVPAPSSSSGDPVSTIASVTAVDRAYDVALAGTVTVGAEPCYRLRLRPLRDPQFYPLRELLVEHDTYRIDGLTYAQPFNGSFANVDYEFMAVGPQHYWTIVHIDATAGREHVSQDLQDIAFPPTAPAADFTP
jgi:hypothetical protein